jgi:ketosteroid isomerase-like protein
LLSFDVVAPLRQRGAEVVRERLRHWFEAFEGAIGCEVRELEVATSNDTAFAHFLQRFSGTNISGIEIDMWVRVTMGLRRVDGRWLIAHEHMSDPFDPDSGMALTHLTP